MAEKRDYYEVLGVAKNCGEDELKKAYRKKAKQCHPDLHPGDQVAEEQFKELNEAYGVLSDPQKRQQYDQFGFAGVDGQGFGDFNAADFDFGDILSQFFGGGFGGFGGGTRRNPNAPRRGADLKYRMTLSFMEAAFGVTRTIHVNKEVNCHVCHGTKAKPGTKVETCPTCHGSGMVHQQQRTLFGVSTVASPCPACKGTGEHIASPCEHCRGTGRETVQKALEVKVPAGINTGEMLTLRGEGEAGYRNGPPGDLYIEVTIKPHEMFQRRQYHTYCEVPISFAQAALGGTLMLPTIHGETEYTIKEGTQPGEVITLKGKGIPVINRPGQFGDHIVTLIMEVPHHLNEKQKGLIRELDGTLSDHNYRKKTSFFQRMKAIFNG